MVFNDDIQPVLSGELRKAAEAVGNQLFDAYDVNTAGAGLEWEF